MLRKKIVAQRRRGFTLAELLVVVAVIAVLVTVVFPVFATALEKSKEAACMANRRSLKSEITETLLTDPSAEAVYSGSIHSLSTQQSREFTCPDGGTITYWVDKVKGVDVFCSKHSQFGKETMSVIIGVVTDIYDNVGQDIDSNALDSGFQYRPQALAKFKAAGIDLDSLGVQTWRISRQYDKMAFQWTTEDITSANAGDKVLVMQYKTDFGYTVWETQVKVATDKNGGFYNILNDGGRTEVTKGLDSSTKADFDAIKAIYNEKANELDIPPLP